LDGYQYQCKDCRKKTLAKSRKKHREKVNARIRNWEKKNPDTFLKYRLQTRYKLTVLEFEKLKNDQEYRCLICRKTEKLCIDHCHTTGKIRGLLCHQCNKGLGDFKDSIEFLTSAISYLKQNE
jgi:hypothetical protein